MPLHTATPCFRTSPCWSMPTSEHRTLSLEHSAHINNGASMPTSQTGTTGAHPMLGPVMMHARGPVWPPRSVSLGTTCASVIAAASTGWRPPLITSCGGSSSPTISGRTYLHQQHGFITELFSVSYRAGLLLTLASPDQSPFPTPKKDGPCVVHCAARRTAGDSAPDRLSPPPFLVCCAAVLRKCIEASGRG